MEIGVGRLGNPKGSWRARSVAVEGVGREKGGKPGNAGEL